MQFATALDTGYCRECKKTVTVVNCEPLEPALWKKITGYHVFVMDDQCQDHWRGYMCFDCVNNLSHTPKISMLAGGGMLPEIHLEKDYFERSKKRNEST